MNKPAIFQLALSRLSWLIDDMKYARHTPRAMRPERMDAIFAVLKAMIKLCCLQFNGAACAVREGWARPITVPELAKLSGLPIRNTERCLHDLTAMCYIDVGKQYRSYNNGTPVFVVSGVMRTFTPKFWKLLDLTELFRRSVQYAREKGKEALKLVVPTYRKAIKKAKKVKNLVSSLLQSVSGGGLDDRAFLNCPWRNEPRCPRPCSRAAECRR